jgi:hypothetical protein
MTSDPSNPLPTGLPSGSNRGSDRLSTAFQGPSIAVPTNPHTPLRSEGRPEAAFPTADLYFLIPEPRPARPRRRRGALVLGPGLPRFDPVAIEAALTRLDPERRGQVWREHVRILRSALLERGMPPAVVEAVLADHREAVRAVHAARRVIA